MKVCLVLAALTACAFAQDGDLAAVSGLTCPMAGYMTPDPNNLCFVWFCERGGEPPIKRACPKGVRVPSWWEGGTLNMCNIVNILKHGGEPTCLRCAANDVRPADTCEDYDESPCPEGCTCETTEHTHRCECPVELGVYADGPAVDMPVDHCSPNPCENGASCQNQWDGFFCFCPNGWTGHRCEMSVCDWHPCLNGGTCVIDEIGYHCECPPCWGGSCCNVTVSGNDCEGIACPPCSTPNDDGTCDPVDDSYCNGIGTCDPDSGECQDCTDKCFTGPLCKTPVDTCECNECPLNSVCENLSDKPTHECICNDCWQGQNCDEPIVDCDRCNPCAADQPCLANGNEVSCGCSDECYSGPNCDQVANTCACNNPCGDDGTCMDTDDGPMCQCEQCKTGSTCEDDIRSCECVSPCSPGQQCTQDEATGEMSCGCSDNCYTGSNCDELLNTCECNNPCSEEQLCSMGDNGPACSCSGPCQTGERCENTIQSCDCANPCDAYGGTCDLGDDGLYCSDCPDCMGGKFCDEPVKNCGECNPCDADTQECYMEGLEAKCECKDCMGGDDCQTPLQTCACNNPCTEDQQICLDGDDGPRCEIGNPSSGNAFTIVFEENHTEKSIRSIPLEVYCTPSTPNSKSRTVNYKSAGLSKGDYCYFDKTETIPENDVLRIEIDRCMMLNKTGLDRVAIKLTEVNNEAMSCYGINKDRWSADGFLATPDIQAGQEYQTTSYSPAHRGTQFAVVGLRDNTEVELTLSDDNDLPAPYNRKGSVYKFTLNAFETFQVQAVCPVERGNKKSACSKDLSGSIIKANKVIHAFSGNIRAFIKAGEAKSRDHLVEQLIPTDRWGKEFGMVTIPGRVVGDLINIMALAGVSTNVKIYYDDREQMSINLPSGGRVSQLVEVPSGKRVFIKSTEPLSVTQMTKSKDTYLHFNETVHDPVSITVPPVGQFANNYFFSTPLFTGGKSGRLQPYQANLALVVAKKGEEGSITLDGAAITEFAMPWGDMPSVDGSEDLVGAVFVIPHGTRLIRSNAGSFQCLIYGYDDRESYGLPAGMDFKKM